MQKLKFPNLLIPCFSPEHASAIIAEATKFGYTVGQDVGDGCIPQSVHLEATGVVWVYNFYSVNELQADDHPIYEGAVICTAKAIRSHVEKLRTVDSTDRLSTLTVKPKSDVEVAEVVEVEPKLSLWSKLVLLFTFVFNYLRGKK